VTSLGWGILAGGKIARRFAADLLLLPDAHVAAVGCRRLESAQAFAATYGGTAHGSYADLVADPAVDVVYVASPHPMHPAHVRLALEAGKPVLCEKPVALNAADATAMFTLAAERGLFLMEAMWTACHPLVRELVRRVRAGAAGRPRHLAADLGWVVDVDPGDRLLDPALGAGALLDMGIYPLTLAHLLLGAPEQLAAVADVRGGVDLDVLIAGRYAGGATAALAASMTGWPAGAATLATDTGRFELAASFNSPRRITWTPYSEPVPGAAYARRQPGTPEDLHGEEPVVGLGYGNEAAHVARCLADGLTTSPWVPPTQTLAVMHQMDAVRAQIGVRYPGEDRTAPSSLHQ
jgi:predicted dehydrogenase